MSMKAKKMARKYKRLNIQANLETSIFSYILEPLWDGWIGQKPKFEFLLNRALAFFPRTQTHNIKSHKVQSEVRIMVWRTKTKHKTFANVEKPLYLKSISSPRTSSKPRPASEVLSQPFQPRILREALADPSLCV